MSRSKIAITIKNDLLARLDRAVDGKTIRNRSHAIEFFLNEALRGKARKALLVSGHKDFFCDTLFEEKSVVEQHIEKLASHGVKDIVLFLHEGERKVEEKLGDGSAYGVSLTYLWQDKEPVGTAYALRVAEPYLKGSDFFLIYCHVLANADLIDFADYHADNDAVATVALTSIADPSLYGTVQMRGEKIVEFVEKPVEATAASRVISAGIFCFSPEIFGQIPRTKTSSLERDVFPKLTKEGMLAGYMFEGRWCNVRNKICFPA